ncbi:trans-sialidase [Trypanosoma cruzi Dm28c]|uniref:Trans-sialidase n=2 Tax=Trypanosoma cruzi TaxID=5693 RepID=V5B5A1_TRYCR|nr:trans-sialidase [Trypanosoma cruzi Dm28c]PBJ77097.1 trans-sialidase [Trypanosoma cruzi cruzi]PWV01133.1 putative trans-sialidase, Group V [Trypanosoma cruzi]
MLSRVAAVKAPRTHNRRGVTGSSGKRRKGRESEPQRPNMSRRVFTSAVLLLLVVMMCCGSGGAAGVAELSDEAKFKWRAITDGETVESLGVPSLLKVGNDVFAVAEAQWKKDVENSVFTGIASQLLTKTADNKPEEVLKNAKDTQILEKVTSPDAEKKVDVSRPTTAVKGSDIYMLVGQYGSKDSQKGDASGCELLLVKGSVSGDGTNNKIDWKDTESSPQRVFGAQLDSWTRLIGSGGSGVNMKDETLVFPVEGTKKAVGTEEDGKTFSLTIYTLKDNTNWKLSKGMSADGCSDPSVVEWEKGKLMMMTACDYGRRRVYESGDKGDSWTEALGTLSRVWGNKHKGKGELVRSRFITATIEDRDVMLVTLPVYSKKDDTEDNDKEKGVLHLWLTDNTHIVDIGPVSGDDDVAASSLLYKSGENGDQGNKDELIALYEKKKSGEQPSLGMVSVRLTEQLKRVKDVLTTWKEVDELVSKLCPSENAKKDESTDTACKNNKITDGLVGFLSGNFSDTTWKDEYLGVNATVNNKAAAEKTDNGVTFKGRGAWAEWPVGRQGENQLYHFANYNFTLVATVSFDGVPKSGSIPLMGAKLNDSDNTVLLGLSYNGKEKKWILLCDDGENKEHSRVSEPEKAQHVVILLRNGNQGSAYVDGKSVGDESCVLKIADSKEISHFYIGGDGKSAEGQEDVSVTVRNVLLYNRPLSFEEIGALNPNTAPFPLLVKEPSTSSPASSASVVTPIPPVAANAQIAGASSTPAGTQQTEREQLMGSSGADSGGASTSAVSAVSTPPAEKDSVKQAASGKSSDGAQTVDVGSTADGEPTMEKRGGGTNGQKEEVQPLNRDENGTALNSSLGHLSQGNNTDAATVHGSGLLSSMLLLLLGLWGFSAL